jgi:hypothetical protein
VRVYVKRKVPLDQLKPEDRLPTQLDGVAVDVLEAEFESHGASPAELQARRMVMQGGMDIGNLLFGGSGTLACSVYDLHGGTQLLLSNWHVLCGRPDCRAGESITQPGRRVVNPGIPENTVAHLHRWALTDEVDAAVAVLNGRRFLTRELAGIGLVGRAVSPVLGARLTKAGRTTGLTSAVVTDVSLDVDVNLFGIGVHRFRNQIVLRGERPSDRGDSGAVWVDDQRRPVGLNFAGSPGMAVANRFETVLRTLQISLDGQSLLDTIVEMA